MNTTHGANGVKHMQQATPQVLGPHQVYSCGTCGATTANAPIGTPTTTNGAGGSTDLNAPVSFNVSREIRGEFAFCVPSVKTWFSRCWPDMPLNKGGGERRVDIFF
jgi:hypothetical protein